MNITFRPITDRDKEFLLVLYTTTRIHEVQPLGWTEQQIQEFMRMQFHCQWNSYKQFQFPNAQHWMIQYDGDDAGQVMVDISEEEILLVDISVLPSFRNRGICTHVTNLYIEEGQKQRKRVRLHVDKYSPGIRLYKKLGFVITGEDTFRYEMIWKGISSNPKSQS